MYQSSPTSVGKKKGSGAEGNNVTCIHIICAAVVGTALGLIALNIYQANSCDSALKKTEQELFIEAINHRLQAAEIENARNTQKMNSLLYTIRTKIGSIDQAEIDALASESADEAVRVALLLAAQPAPARPYTYETSADGFSTQVVDDQEGAGIGAEQVGGAPESANGWESIDGNSQEENPISDAEATEFCLSWKSQYDVIPGVSWGTLPTNLQQKWMLYSCDYHLADSAEISGFESAQEHAESHEQARRDHRADGGEGGDVEKELQFLEDDILGKYKSAEKKGASS